jgi:tRNA (adenine57-N1/adenine58-N1)-methyltransferase catalytic subunit
MAVSFGEVVAPCSTRSAAPAKNLVEPRAARYRSAMHDPAHRLAAGDAIVFVDREGREHMALLTPGRVTDIRGNLIPHDRLIGAPEGLSLRGSQAVVFRVVRATLAQYARSMQRHATIIYPKDTALLVAYGDVFPGATVVEGGYGSGALSLALLRAIGPASLGGRLVTYELRLEAKNRSDKNVRAYLGEQPHHHVKLADIYLGIDERHVDRVILDVPEPWDVVAHAALALCPGGVFAAYVPTTLQLHRLVLALAQSRRFLPAQALETIERPWFVTPQSCRPAQKIIGHTGFLCFARAVSEAFVDCVD